MAKYLVGFVYGECVKTVCKKLSTCPFFRGAAEFVVLRGACGAC